MTAVVIEDGIERQSEGVRISQHADFDLRAAAKRHRSYQRKAGEAVLRIDPVATRDNPYQPRRDRNHVVDRKLAASVRAHGVQQPVISSPMIMGSTPLFSAIHAGMPACA